MVVGLNDASAVTAGHLHACARRAGGAIECWGSNSEGQLGDGTTTDSNVPVTQGRVVASVAAVGSPATEGNEASAVATFTVSLSTASAQTVSVEYATSPGSATPGSDYASSSGLVTFAPGETSKSIVPAVTLFPDDLDEFNETFSLNLTGAANADLGLSSAVWTIVDDDPAPVLSVDDVSVVEGNTGTKTVTFTISAVGRSSRAVTFDVATADGSATAADYAGGVMSVSWPPGIVSSTVGFVVNGDTSVEANETFSLVLSNVVNATIGDGTGVATITNDDASTGPVAISVNNVWVAEQGGPAVFDVRLSGPSTKTVSVTVASADSTATAGSDYTALSPTVLTFAPGEVAKTVSVPVTNDGVFEGNEFFTVNLTSPVNAPIADSQGAATVVDDEGPIAVPWPIPRSPRATPARER